MTPDDPRHGTPAGFAAHERLQVPACVPCQKARNRYLKEWRLRGCDSGHTNVPAIGYTRRLRALAHAGWPLESVAEQAHVGIGTIHRITHARVKVVRSSTAESLRHVFELLAMRPGPSAETARRAAARGYAPALAWDDIDDPAERPKGIPKTTAA